MALLLLILVNLLLLIGMVCLQPLAAGGIGSAFTRVWLFFGLLIFASHYNYYCLELKKKKRHQARQAGTTNQYRSERLPVRSSVYK